ncbi:hypothetical protein ABZS66_55590 [Dactylosporangium sp. NPDC005572]|uniref:hypothetical protein n=1 Tax=Dactylosporangium sp. NPDC005572 TaxID=3156889 RepID=UPI00339E9C60
MAERGGEPTWWDRLLPVTAGRDEEPAAWWERSLAALAALSAVLAMIWIFGVSTFPLTAIAAVPLAVVAALPLIVPGRRPFAVTSVTCAVVLIVLAIPLYFLCAHLFLPSAVLLLLAAFGRRARLPYRVWVPAIALLLVVVTGLWSSAIWQSVLSTPNVYVVHLPHNGPYPGRDITNGDGSGIGFGATMVSMGDDTLYVSFRKGLSDTEVARLDARLHELMPYATSIERCRSHRRC